jgi:serine protease
MPVKVCQGYWEIMFARGSAGTPGFASQGAATCPVSTIALGIRYAADNGARVINISLGGAGASTTLRDALIYAVGRGCFIALSAGNEFEKGSPANYPSAYAAEIDGVMSVAAVGRSLRHAYYSSAGPSVEISAPGGDVREGGTSAGIWQHTILFDDSDPARVRLPRFDRYAEASYQGTSMASPHVAGIAALMMSQYRGPLAPAFVEQIIKLTARPCDALDCNPATAQVGTTGRNDTFGYGLIQARAAVLPRDMVGRSQ